MSPRSCAGQHPSPRSSSPRQIDHDVGGLLLRAHGLGHVDEECDGVAGPCAPRRSQAMLETLIWAAGLLREERVA